MLKEVWGDEGGVFITLGGRAERRSKVFRGR